MFLLMLASAIAGGNDYPAPAVQAHEEVTTYYRLTVNVEGKVKDCTITQSSGHPSLDQAACRQLTERARFKPALDKHGRVIESTYSNRVAWKIPH